jgi:hypothetical protein
LAKNKYKINGETTVLYLDRKDGSVIETIIDTEDLERVMNYKYKWYAKFHVYTHSFYSYSTVYNGSPKQGFHNSTIKLSCFIMNFPEGVGVDHENHDTLDNRKSNLRPLSSSDNSKNRTTKNSNNKTGHRNICLIKNRYVVQLQVDGRNKVFGRFININDAIKCAEENRKLYYGDFAGNG